MLTSLREVLSTPVNAPSTQWLPDTEDPSPQRGPPLRQDLWQEAPASETPERSFIFALRTHGSQRLPMPHKVPYENLLDFGSGFPES